jgi:hypothetical protein
VIEVAHEISQVDRRVRTRTLEAGEARVVAVSRVYDAPLAAAARAWHLSEEGLTFVAPSSERWGEASVAAGTDPAAARAAAGRTTGFSSGQPVE